MLVNTIGSQTMVGYGRGPYPMRKGNCFDLGLRDINGSYFRIVNFGMEDFKELLKRGIITFPVEIQPLDDRVAILNDERIPKEWYTPHYCTICCPYDLLPEDEKKEFDLKWERVTTENGFTYLKGRV